MSVNGLERRLAEAYQETVDSFGRPARAVVRRRRRLDATRQRSRRGPPPLPFQTAAQHRDIRDQCRALAAGNEFAINAHENRVSYLVGAGHDYHVTTKKGQAPGR